MSAQAAFHGALRHNPANPRYFTDDTGERWFCPCTGDRVSTFSPGSVPAMSDSEQPSPYLLQEEAIRP